jgi:cbb3-type cytochrome oxidase subunit 3
MDAIKLLFGSDIGLMSVFTIVFVIVIAIVLYRFGKAQMEKDARNAK